MARRSTLQRFGIADNGLWAFLVVCAALMQTTWLGKIEIHNVRPDLVLLFVVYFGLTEGEERAMFTGVLGGMFQDIAGNNSLGHHILSHVIVGYVVGRIATRLVTEHPAVKIAAVFIASLVYGLLYIFIQYVETPSTNLASSVTALVIPRAFYTALVTPVVFGILARSFHRRRLQAEGRLF